MVEQQYIYTCTLHNTGSRGRLGGLGAFFLLQAGDKFSFIKYFFYDHYPGVQMVFMYIVKPCLAPPSLYLFTHIRTTRL